MMNGTEQPNARQLAIEQSLTKRRRFKEKLCHRFTQAIADFQLVEPNDKIAVCISGGKDSMLMAKLFQNLKRHNKFPFETVFLVMDPGYHPGNRRQIERNAALLGVPVTIFESDIFDSVVNVEKSPCYLCARMRRGHLYKRAQELGCNKIALGHHYDDVIETNLMSMLWGGQIQTMMPKLHSTNFAGMELIRPMYYIREEDIIAWRDQNHLTFLRCACRFTEKLEAENGDGASASKRRETKLLIQQLKKTNPAVEANIFNSMHNVALDAVIAYKTKGVKHHFLEHYRTGERSTPMIPNDPMILLSYVNTKLRDDYPSLDALCDDLNADKAALEEKLRAIDYTYSAELNRFV